MPGYEGVKKAAALLEAAKLMTEQKMYFGKGSSDDIEKLLLKMRNEAYDLLQGKINEEGYVVVTTPAGMSGEDAFAFIEEVRKQFSKKIAKDAEDKKSAGSAQQPTPPTPSMPKVTPSTEGAPPPPKTEERALVDVVPTATEPLKPPADDTPANVTKGMRAPKVMIPEDTTKRRSKP